MSKKILIIQTAFIGDVILATAVSSKLNAFNNEDKLCFLVRKGNEGLVESNPHIDKVYVWDKRSRKYANLLKILKQIRREKFDVVINLQRYFSTGIVTIFSKSKQKIGFKDNPLSIFFSIKKSHDMGNGMHEVERNQLLIEHLSGSKPDRPFLHLDEEIIQKVEKYSNKRDYITIAPASVWYTKQFPVEMWIDFVNKVPSKYSVFIIGAPSDNDLAKSIINQSDNKSIINLCGKISLLESAALMKKAHMNYVNDSAPLHLASATNAPVRAIFCSTVPEFGFGPLSDNSEIIQIKQELECRPCGLHGKKNCPLGTFECATKIDIDEMLKSLI